MLLECQFLLLGLFNVIFANNENVNYVVRIEENLKDADNFFLVADVPSLHIIYPVVQGICTR